MQKTIMPTPVRMKECLKQWVKDEAEKNRRSVNSEMIVLIEEAKKAREQNASS